MRACESGVLQLAIAILLADAPDDGDRDVVRADKVLRLATMRPEQLNPKETAGNTKRIPDAIINKNVNVRNAETIARGIVPAALK